METATVCDVEIENRKSKIGNPLGSLVAVTVVAVALTYVFWRPLWHGGGLVGGDTYSYYYPQKTFYADELHAGRIPLWNSLVGHGYPTVGESQTAVYYPLNLALFSLLPVNTAYNAAQLLHYVLAFVMTWLLARRLGLGVWGALLCALVYVYGWFAPRICLEWAIIGGVYLPLLVWCAESYLQTRQSRYLALLSIALGVHLLAGHFNLAFIEVLAVAAYSTLRVLLSPPLSRDRRELQSSPHSGERHPEGTRVKGAEHTASPPRSLKPLVPIVLALIAGFGLAAVQLAPTWELKQRSQRADVGRAHDPAYGHIPPWYLVQVVTPWMWYAPDVNADDALASIRTLTYPAATNKVEAHLYFGLVPFWLAVVGLWRRWRDRDPLPAPLRIWLWIGLAAAVYATAWLLPITRHLPGFSFFIGPGRYGILTTLAVGLLAGDAFDRWLSRRAGIARTLVIVAVLGLTLLDLWVVRIHWNHRSDGAPNWYADLVSDPPIRHRDESEVRSLLAQWPQPVRMWGSFQNMPTITGFAMTPTYLGLSPAEYLDPELTLPKPAGEQPTPEEINAQVEWLRRAGVTHILAERPLDVSLWPVELVWSGYDALLHRAWARQEPLHLYTLKGSRGRASLDSPDAGTAEVTEYSPHRIAVKIDAQQPAELILTDLNFPGWNVALDGKPVVSQPIDRMYRGIHVEPGQHTAVWTYEPHSIRIGAIISAATAVVLAMGLWVARRR